MVISKSIGDMIFNKEQNAGDLFSLYCFYYFTAKWQHTNQAWALKEYCMKALDWGDERFSRTYKRLEELKLIETIIRRNEDGKMKRKSRYVRVKFIWGRERLTDEIIHQRENPLLGKPSTGDSVTNALSTNSLNALSVGSEQTKILNSTPVETELEYILIGGYEEAENFDSDGNISGNKIINSVTGKKITNWELNKLKQAYKEKYNLSAKKEERQVLKKKEKPEVEEKAKKAVEIWNKYKTIAQIGVKGFRNSTVKDQIIPECVRITPDIVKELKRLSDYSVEDFEIAVKKYVKDILNRTPDNDYARHRYSFYEFLKKEGGFINFLNK